MKKVDKSLTENRSINEELHKKPKLRGCSDIYSSISFRIKLVNSTSLKRRRAAGFEVASEESHREPVGDNDG